MQHIVYTLAFMVIIELSKKVSKYEYEVHIPDATWTILWSGVPDASKDIKHNKAWRFSFYACIYISKEMKLTQS